MKQGEEHPPGVVLASEFSACSSMLNGALRINPFDIKRVVTALDHALRLELGERSRRRDRDLPYISERPSSLWTRQVLQDLWAAKAEAPELLKMEGSGGVRVQYQPVWQTTFKHLGNEEVQRAYAKASRRFIFTDFGGTLMEKERVDLYIKRSFTQTTGKRCVLAWSLVRMCVGGGGGGACMIPRWRQAEGLTPPSISTHAGRASP